MDEKQLEELIEKAWEKFYDAGGLRPTFSKWHVCEVFKSALREVFGEVTSRSLQGWISVEDQLPETRVAVLVYCPDFPDPLQRKAVAWRKGDRWQGYNYGIYDEFSITHWQPLPPVDLGKALSGQETACTSPSQDNNVLQQGADSVASGGQEIAATPEGWDELYERWASVNDGKRHNYRRYPSIRWAFLHGVNALDLALNVIAEQSPDEHFEDGLINVLKQAAKERNDSNSEGGS